MFDDYKPTPSDHFGVIVGLGVLIGGLTAIWVIFHVLAYEVYWAFAFTAAMFGVFRWPKAHWLGVDRVIEAKNELGRTNPKGTRTCFFRVSELNTHAEVRRYYAAVTRVDDTHELCDEVWESAIEKAIVYLVLTIAFLALAEHHSETSREEIAKAVATFAAFAAYGAWDVAKCVFLFKKNNQVSQQSH